MLIIKTLPAAQPRTVREAIPGLPQSSMGYIHLVPPAPVPPSAQYTRLKVV